MKVLEIDGQVPCVLFTERASNLSFHNLPTRLGEDFGGHSNTHTQYEEPAEILGFYQKQKFIPIQNEIIQIHTYGKDPSCLLNETNFQQKGPKQTGPSPLK